MSVRDFINENREALMRTYGDVRKDVDIRGAGFTQEEILDISHRHEGNGWYLDETPLTMYRTVPPQLMHRMVFSQLRAFDVLLDSSAFLESAKVGKKDAIADRAIHIIAEPFAAPVREILGGLSARLNNKDPYEKPHEKLNKQLLKHLEQHYVALKNLTPAEVKKAEEASSSDRPFNRDALLSEIENRILGKEAGVPLGEFNPQGAKPAQVSSISYRVRSAVSRFTEAVRNLGQPNNVNER